jgi:hypothetical protein
MKADGEEAQLLTWAYYQSGIGRVKAFGWVRWLGGGASGVDGWESLGWCGVAASKPAPF